MLPLFLSLLGFTEFQVENPNIALGKGYSSKRFNHKACGVFKQLVITWFIFYLKKTTCIEIIKEYMRVIKILNK